MRNMADLIGTLGTLVDAIDDPDFDASDPDCVRDLVQFINTQCRAMTGKLPSFQDYDEAAMWVHGNASRTDEPPTVIVDGKSVVACGPWNTRDWFLELGLTSVAVADGVEFGEKA